MSDVSVSPTSVVAYGSKSATGGTCFLDLPFELRTMVYDLSMSDRYDWDFPLPGQPKAKVMGINFLQLCKQIRQETHTRVWCGSWTIRIPPDTSSINLRFATSSLNDLALAKIKTLRFDIQIDPDTLSSWGPINLEVLPTFASLLVLDVDVQLGNRHKKTRSEQSEDLIKSVFLRGLVTQILLQTPQHIPTLLWDLTFWNSNGIHCSDALESIAKEYKHLQVSNYLPKIRNLYDLSSSSPLQPNTPVRSISPGLQFTP